MFMDKQTREARESVKQMKFSDRLKHFWYYNKIAVIVTVLIVAIVGYSVYQTVTATKYDLQIVYYGERSFTDEQIAALEEYLSNVIEDIDGNGEKNVSFNVYTSQGGDTSEYGIAIQQKYTTELYAGAYPVYIVSPKYYENFDPENDNDIADSVYEVNQSSVLREILGECDDERWCVRSLYDNEKDNKKCNLIYNNAKIAEKALFEVE